MLEIVESLNHNYYIAQDENGQKWLAQVWREDVEKVCAVGGYVNKDYESPREMAARKAFDAGLITKEYIIHQAINYDTPNGFAYIGCTIEITKEKP